MANNRKNMKSYKYNFNSYTCKIAGRTVPVGALYGRTNIRVSNKKLFTNVYWLITDKNIYQKTFDYLQDDGEIKTITTAFIKVSIHVPELDRWVNYEIRPFIGTGKQMRYNAFYKGILDNYTESQRESLVDYPKYAGIHKLSYNACVKGEALRKFKGKPIKAASKEIAKADSKERENTRNHSSWHHEFCVSENPEYAEYPTRLENKVIRDRQFFDYVPMQ